MEQRFITMGEIMLRLTPPNYEKIRMTHSFEASYGGAVGQYSTCACKPRHRLYLLYGSTG